MLQGGRPLALTSPGDAIAAGIALIPEDRRLQGLVLDHSVRDNLALPLLGDLRRRGLVAADKVRDFSDDLIERFAVKVARPDAPVRLLSGGNQQKVVIAKWLGTDPDVLVMDEPTAGVDVGTKSEIVRHRARTRRERKGDHRDLIGIPGAHRHVRPVPHHARRDRGRVDSRVCHQLRGRPRTRRPGAGSMSATTAAPRAGTFAGLTSRLDWRRDIIYIGFVVVFLVFAVLLGDEGFMSTHQPAQHPSPGLHRDGHGCRHDLRHRQRRDRPVRGFRGGPGLHR